jgi:hypothetical protein
VKFSGALPKQRAAVENTTEFAAVDREAAEEAKE